LREIWNINGDNCCCPVEGEVKRIKLVWGGIKKKGFGMKKRRVKNNVLINFIIALKMV